MPRLRRAPVFSPGVGLPTRFPTRARADNHDFAPPFCVRARLCARRLCARTSLCAQALNCTRDFRAWLEKNYNGALFMHVERVDLGVRQGSKTEAAFALYYNRPIIVAFLETVLMLKKEVRGRGRVAARAGVTFPV